jgi:FACT complex subunit SPT16
LLLNGKNSRVFKTGMTFVLRVGFQNVPNSGKYKTFSCLLADTLLITEDEPKVLTHVRRNYKEIIYEIGGDSASDVEQADAQPLDVDMGSRTTRRAAAAASKPMEDKAREAERQEHQRQLAERRREERLRDLAKESTEAGFDEKKKATQRVHAYDSPADYPTRARRNELYVDIERESLLVPINNQLVPFHISTIKGAHRSDTAGYKYLRINFLTPDIIGSKTYSLPAVADKNKYFIQELSFRSKSSNLGKVYFQINELRKRVISRRKEAEQKASLIVQEKLKTAPPGTFPRMKDVSVRPSLERGTKKQTGTLELQRNGLRFRSLKGGHLDIIFKNIKHAFFQPADAKHNSTVLIHFQLHNAIMVGKKKSDYVQFFFEVTEASTDVSRRQRDDDGMIEERMEHERRQKWNERFKEFVRRMEDHVQRLSSTPLEFGVPYDELAFYGVPNKETVRITPTVHCLVALGDSPPLAVTLNDVEIVNFERVQFNLRNFDVRFVMKDFETVYEINAIEMEHLEMIKEWLKYVGIVLCLCLCCYGY